MTSDAAAKRPVSGNSVASSTAAAHHSAQSPTSGPRPSSTGMACPGTSALQHALDDSGRDGVGMAFTPQQILRELRILQRE